jgi:CheY-like chemotaxis protein
MKLMIVDDHPGVRAMILRIIELPGDEVCECPSGVDAIRQAGSFAPDLVTMDLRMPGIGGLEATRGVLAARPSALVVVVSAHPEEELRLAAMRAGAFAFVAKENLHELKVYLRTARETGR